MYMFLLSTYEDYLSRLLVKNPWPRKVELMHMPSKNMMTTKSYIHVWTILVNPPPKKTSLACYLSLDMYTSLPKTLIHL